MTDIIKEAHDVLGGVVLAIDEDGDAYALPSGAHGNLVALPARNDDYAIQHPEIWGAMVARFNVHPALIARIEAAEAALARAYMAGRDDAAKRACGLFRLKTSGLYGAFNWPNYGTLTEVARSSILAISVPADLAKRLGASHD